MKVPLPAAVCLLVGATVAYAPAQEETVFSTEVEVVNLFATVRDKKGRLVNDLSQDDFVLKEDGKRQTIKYFSRETDLPLTIGLLVDTSLSQRRILEQERTASYRFFERLLDNDEDLAFLISFDVDVELLQDLTHSKNRLERALAELRMPARSRPRGPRRYLQFPGGGRRGGSNPQGGGGRPGIGTALYDAVFLAADEVLRGQAGRKALVLISDGVDFGSLLGPDEAVEAVHRSDAVLFSILYADEAGYGGGFGRRGRGRGGWDERPDGRKALRKLSEQTGGSLYELSKGLSLDEIFDRIEEELRSQYSIGYTPEHKDAGDGFRKIELKAKGKGLKVFARSGYYPSDP